MDEVWVNGSPHFLLAGFGPQILRLSSIHLPLDCWLWLDKVLARIQSWICAWLSFVRDSDTLWAVVSFLPLGLNWLICPTTEEVVVNVKSLGKLFQIMPMAELEENGCSLVLTLVGGGRVWRHAQTVDHIGQTDDGSSWLWLEEKAWRERVQFAVRVRLPFSSHCSKHLNEYTSHRTQTHEPEHKYCFMLFTWTRGESTQRFWGSADISTHTLTRTTNHTSEAIITAFHIRQVDPSLGTQQPSTTLMTLLIRTWVA